MSSVSTRGESVAVQRWFLIGLVVLFVGLSVQYSYKALYSSHKDAGHRSAILRWQEQIRGLDDDIDISQRYNYPNPPVMAVLLYPLAKLPPLASALGWFYLKVALTMLALVWIFRLVETPDRPFPAWGKGLTILLSLRPIIGDLQHGNVNLFILFLVVAFLTLFRCRRDVLAGLVLGLAIACKVTPALFLPYLVWKRAWKTLAGSVVGLVLFLYPGLVPGLILGFAENDHQVRSWYQNMVVPFIIEGKVTSEHNNQSLPGLLARLLTHSPSFSEYDAADQYQPTAYHNVLTLDPVIVRGLVKVAIGLFALLVVWACRTPTQTRQGWRLGAEFAIVLLGMLLFSERTWKHHAVTLCLPFAVLCYYLSAYQPVGQLRTFLIATLVGSTLLMATTATGLLPDAFAKLAQVYGAYVMVYGVLLLALALLLLTPKEDPV
jgi:alpha-1,2-mannosyltransferase